MGTDIFFSEDFLSMLLLIFLIMVLNFIIYFIVYWKRERKQKDKYNKRKDTLNFCLNDEINYEETFLKLDNYHYEEPFELERSSNLLKILSRFEKISIGIQSSVFDEDIIRAYYGKYFIMFFKEFRYFILKRREETKDSYLFIEYEKIVQKWFNYRDNDFKDFKRRDF